MKKKLIFSGIALLALVLTTATIADAVMTTYELSAGQPDWDDILPEGEYDSEYLLPSAAGDDTELPTQSPSSGEHWDKVDDMPADDGDTYVSTLSSQKWEKDLYNLTNFSQADGYETINSVTVYFCFAAGGNYNVRAMAEIKTNGKVFSGTS